jgi:HEAT repeat protein
LEDPRARTRRFRRILLTSLAAAGLVAGAAVIDFVRTAHRVEGLFEELGSPDDEIARAAEEELGSLRGPWSASCIVRVASELGDRLPAYWWEPRSLRSDKVIAFSRAFRRTPFVLRRIGRPAVRPLLRLLRMKEQHPENLFKRWLASAKGEEIQSYVDRDRAGYVLALRSLPFIGEDAAGPLITMLNDSDAENRETAIHVLTNFTSERVTYALLQTGLYHRDERTRTEVRLAWSGLLEMDRSAYSILCAALSDGNAEVRAASARLLGETKDSRAVAPLFRALRDKDANVVSAADTALWWLVAFIPTKELRALADLEWPPMARGIVNEILGCAESVEDLISALDSDQWNERRCAAMALGGLGDPRAVEPLAKVLADADLKVRTEVARALHILGDTRGTDFMLAMLRSESEQDRTEAAHVITEIEGAFFVEPMLEALNDNSIPVRCSAALYLARVGEPRAVGPIIRLLKDTDMWHPASALGDMGGDRAVKALLETVAGAQADERGWIEADSQVAAALRALAKLDVRKTYEHAVRLLYYRMWPIGGAAVQALAEIRDPRAVEPLKRRAYLLSWGDNAEDFYVWDILVALERIGTPEAREAVDQIIRDFGIPYAPVELALILHDSGLQGIIDDYGALFKRHRNHSAGMVYSLALERSGDRDMARALFSSRCCCCLGARTREWARRHGCLEYVEGGDKED